MKKSVCAASAFAIALALSSSASFAGVRVIGCGAFQTFETSSATAYSSDANGIIASVAVGPDLRDILAQGCRSNDSTQANGLFPITLPLQLARTGAGASTPAAATTNVWGVSQSLGTSSFLVSEAANSNTKTDTAVFDVVLPRSFVAGSNITVTTNDVYVLGGGTVGTHTLTVHAYRTANDGTQGADMVATGALTVPIAAADQVSTITGTTLNPGDRVLISVVGVIQDSGGSAITMDLNSVRLN